MTRRPWGPITWMVVPALAALQLIAPVVAGLAPAAHAAAAGQITLRVRSARTVNAADPGTPQKGDPVKKYSWLIAAEDVGNPRYSGDVANCTPKDADGTSHGAAYRPGTGHLPYDPADGSCQWPSTRYTPGNVPVVAEGDQADFAPDANGFATQRLDLPAGRYLVSVTADGYKIDGAHFDVAGDGSLTNVVVDSQPLPVPLGTVRLRVFQDTAPVDGTYEVDIERPLAGFTVHLSDVLGEVTTDFYGQPLCTVYQHDGAATTANPEGTGRVSFGDDGAPIVFSHPGCRSDATGDVAIPNLGADRYAASVIAPSGQSWYQTTTLEGAHDWDIWTSEGDTGLDTEQTVGGEPVPAVDMGFVPHGYESDGTPRFAAVTAKRAGPRSGAGPNSSRTVTLRLSSASAPSTPVPVGSQIVVSGVSATSGVTYNGPRTVTASDATSISYVTNGGSVPGAIGPLGSAGRVTLPDAGPAAFATSNGGEIKGTAVEINTYVGGTGGVAVPNAGVAGASVRGPVDRPFVTLSDLGNNDQMAYVGRGGRPTASSTSPNVPDGELPAHPLGLRRRTASSTASTSTVNNGGQTVDVGQKGLVGWYADIKGTIFVDTNGNGKRDPGEQGVPQFPSRSSERDNSLLDQGQNIATTDDTGQLRDPRRSTRCPQVARPGGLQHPLQDHRHHRPGRQRAGRRPRTWAPAWTSACCRSSASPAGSTGGCSPTPAARTAGSSERSPTTRPATSSTRPTRSPRTTSPASRDDAVTSTRCRTPTATCSTTTTVRSRCSTDRPPGNRGHRGHRTPPRRGSSRPAAPHAGTTVSPLTDQSAAARVR